MELTFKYCHHSSAGGVSVILEKQNKTEIVFTKVICLFQCFLVYFLHSPHHNSPTWQDCETIRNNSPLSYALFSDRSGILSASQLCMTKLTFTCKYLLVWYI